MHETVKISSRQLTILAILITVGDSILILPSIPLHEAKRDAWMSAILGLALGLLVVLLFVSAAKINNKLTLIELNKKILGSWIGNSLSLLFLGYVLLSISAYLREVGDFAISQVMPDTPIQAIEILLLLIVIMGVRLGLETFSRVAELWFPGYIMLSFVLIFTLVPTIDLNKIQPIFDQGFKPILRGTIACIALPFMELVIFMMIFPSVNKPNEIKRGMFLGALLGGILLIIAVTLVILVVGAEPSANSIYPSYDAVKRISVGEFFQRVEATFALMWIVTVYYKITLYFYAFVKGMSQLLMLKNDRMLTLPTSMIIIVLSLVIAPNISYYDNFTAKYWPYLDLTFCVFLPILLLIGYILRKRSS